MKNRKKGDIHLKVLIILFSVIGFLFLVSAAINWDGSQNTLYNFTESESLINFDFNNSLNFTDGDSFENISEFAFGTTEGNNLTINGISFSPSEISSWFNLSDQKNKNATINSTFDNRTGIFKIPMIVNGAPGGSWTPVRAFTFNIYPINDEPHFTHLNETYVFPADTMTFGSEEYNKSYNITVYDEEIFEGTGNPLNYTYNITNCTLAGWLNQPGDCNDLLSSLNLDLIDGSNDTAIFLYTYNESEIGNYTINVSVQDNSSCENLYNLYNNSICNSTYEVPNLINQTISLVVEGSLDIYLVGCDGQIFEEGESNAYCNISIRTRYQEDPVNTSSIAYFANDLWESPSNPNWFYSANSNQSNSSLMLEIPILVNTTKRNVGNWTINFTADDSRSPITKQFNISIVKNSSDGPTLSTIDQQNFSTYSISTISFNVTDEDLLIEDKSVYNESFDFDLEVKYENGSSTGNLFNESFFNISVGDEGLTNIQPGEIEFVPSPEHAGNFTVQINVTDNESLTDSISFDMLIELNNPPEWNDSSTYEFNLTVNSTYATTTDSLSINLIDEGYVYDIEDNSSLEFVIQGDYPESLTVSNSTKMLSFSPWKQDVGYWEFNITVIDDAGLNDTSEWVINVSNINSIPEIEFESFNSNLNNKDDEGNLSTSEGNLTTIQLVFYDEDLLINAGNNESLSISNLVIQNQSDVPENLSFSFSELSTEENASHFKTNFTPRYENIGGHDEANYTIFIEVIDLEGATTNYTLNFTIFSQNTPPTINNLTNQSTSILNESFTYNVSISDSKDDYNLTDDSFMNYTLTALDGGPILNITNLTTGCLISVNFSNNESLAGEWLYQLNVTDSDNDSTVENFTFFVYGSPNITTPIDSTILNLTEGTLSLLNFSLDYAINNTNLTYNISLDKIVPYEDNSTISYNYTNQTIVQTGTFIYVNSSENVSINFTPDYSDETYINFTKNFTLEIFHQDYLNLTDNETWQTNITHANQNITFNYSNNISDQTNTTVNTIYIDLKDHFNDVDVFDPYYNQAVNFTITKSDGNRSDLTDSAIINSNWIFSIVSDKQANEEIKITAWEYNISDENSSLENNVTSNSFNITFLEGDDGTSDTNTGSSGGSSSRTEHYALKIITPDNVKISDEDYIIVNFSLYNSGEVSLSGIDLSSIIELSGITSEDLKISFSDDYVESLAVGETKNYSMRVDVNTGAVGKYDITIFGNVTSPKFSDWATFSIEVLAVDESQLSQLLIFTEKLVSENPECLELRESYSEAKRLFDTNSLVEANKLLNNIITACEESITRNEQIKNNETKVKTTLIYTLITTISILLMGFVYYTIRKIRFNKSKNKEYI